MAKEHTLHHHDAALPLIYSTPHMIGLMEWAAANAMKPYCDEGEISVGTAINIEHRPPLARKLSLRSRTGIYF